MISELYKAFNNCFLFLFLIFFLDVVFFFLIAYLNNKTVANIHLIFLLCKFLSLKKQTNSPF